MCRDGLQYLICYEGQTGWVLLSLVDGYQMLLVTTRKIMKIPLRITAMRM